MKVRARKARINRALARELWLTPHLKRVAIAIVRKSDEDIKNGRCKKYESFEEFQVEIDKLFEEILKTCKDK